jgi:hypothetical protein
MLILTFILIVDALPPGWYMKGMARMLLRASAK